mmetsp:Transcript_20691/g.23129  ORF Transcript_20691/g.23129 Transcript_20691/m.23129 type:complete len:556 (-) Transcript_20691:21-1688(-)
MVPQSTSNISLQEQKCFNNYDSFEQTQHTTAATTTANNSYCDSTESIQSMESDGLLKSSDTPNTNTPWTSSGKRWKDWLHFVGPGWFVCIAYVDPGNYQADIQAGATSRYRLLWTVWWASILSLYIQSLCVRLAYYGQVTLAEVQARDLPRRNRYLNWMIAEFSAVITDLPEVIGIGIAGHIFFGWPYYIGVVLSLVTTMTFLATIRCGMRVVELIVVIFVGIMSVVLVIEMALLGVNVPELLQGWVYGFTETTSADLFSVTGIVGCVVMPHNLYLHSATCQSRPVQRDEATVRLAVQLSSWEPALPVLVSFFVNTAIVAIGAETVYGEENAENSGIVDFCNYLAGTGATTCLLFGIALVSAGQSSAITSTYTGQYVMDGFLDLRLPIWARALLTRLVAMVPCIILAVAYPDGTSLNMMINFVNSSLAFLLPFALTPLIKYNCSTVYMGKYAAQTAERWLLYALGMAVYFLNAYALSAPGGGFFGDLIAPMEWSPTKMAWIGVSVVVQVFYFVWNVHCILTPVAHQMRPLEEERPHVEGEFAMAGDLNCLFLKRE